MFGGEGAEADLVLGIVLNNSYKRYLSELNNKLQVMISKFNMVRF